MYAAACREPLSPVDRARLRMDQPTNPMISTSVLVFDRPMDVDRVRVGVATDAGLVPDPEAIAAGFEREIERIVELSG